MSKKSALYVGRAGQLAVMAEFLFRGWNVAIPEVDVGDDIFVVQDEKGILYRVQAKTAVSQPKNKGYSAQFHVPGSQIKSENAIKMFFVFAVRHDNLWKDFMIVSRGDLVSDLLAEKPGDKTSYGIYLSFENGKVTCGGRDCTRYLNDFSEFPLRF